MDPSMLGLDNKVALVTGGGRNIGKGCAMMLARAGCHVCVVDIDAEAGRQTATEIEATGRSTHFVEGDVREAETIEMMVQAAVGQLGGLDVCVNNVGGWAGYGYTPLVDVTSQQFADVVALNFWSVYFGIQTEAKSMIDRNVQGSIINVSSAGGLRARQGSSPYGASKGAVNNLTMQAAFELGPHGIRVNCLAPALVPGDRQQQGSGNALDPVAQVNPLRRLPRAEEVGGAAVFLASSLSSYVTGQVIAVDGGDTIASPLGGVTAGGNLNEMLRAPSS